ncbi:MAG: pilus assembly protein [Acidimicrobiales bacterium]|nr:pilus assembly protein [Acidimicrobiales bacterium]
MIVSPKRLRSQSEDGAVVVEMAFISIILVMLIAGTFNYGFAWRAGLAVNEAARTGARVGSGQSVSRGADYYALNGVRSSLQSAGLLGNVKKVVIFKATTADGKVPSSCLLASPTGLCNVLKDTQLANLTLSSFDLTISGDPAVAPSGSGCLKSTAALRSGWCPNVRTNIQDTGSDYYGVYVEVFVENHFKMLGQGQTVTRTAVMQLEPAV